MKDAGLTDEEMGIKPGADEGLTDEEMGLPADQPKKEGRGALATAGLNLLDGASIIGIPRALAAGEAASESFANLVTGDDTDKEGLVDRYHRKVKENAPIQQGMEEDFAEHPGAAIGGQLSTALIPGPKLNLVKGSGRLVQLAAKYPGLAKVLGTAARVSGRGAIQGALHGALAGDADTSGGDFAGTAEDTLKGAGIGAGIDAVFHGGGKIVEKMGEAAGKKLRSNTLTKAKSIIGK